jgi:hypothetical protein
MRRIAIIFLTIILLSVSSSAYASFGLFKPSSKLYFLQPKLESLRLFFSFSKEAKLNYLFKLTERRIDEMDVRPSEEIANRYTEHFKQMERIAEGIENKNQEEVAERIREASLRQQEVLAKVYNQVPEQAKEAILNAQEASSKHVEKTIERVEGAEEAEAYAAEAARIQQIGQLGQLEKLERIQQTPMEASPQTNPSQSIPQKLEPARELNREQELKPLNPVFEGQEGNGEGQGQAGQAAQQLPRQAPAEKM